MTVLKSRLLQLSHSQLIALFDQLLDTLHEAVTIVDDQGIVLGWNQKAQRLYEIPGDEIVGQPIASFGWRSLMVPHILDEGRNVRDVYHEPREGTHVLINATKAVENNKLIGAIAAEQEITQLVRLHRGLVSSGHLQEMETDPSEDPFASLKCLNESVQNAIQIARRVAPTDATVLITGESGVGKDRLAKAIHAASHRKGALQAINCGAIPAPLFESELFGYQAGAFTGADRRGRAGKFEAANGGTLFLDEIGELPKDLQVKLLRALETKEITRVGGTTPIPIDVRIIAATNQNLEEMVSNGLFRQDLYYRLNVVPITLSPLRKRLEDLPNLIYQFSREFAQFYNRAPLEWDEESIVALLRYPWPGNIRELRNLIERLTLLSDSVVPNRDLLYQQLKIETIQVPAQASEPAVWQESSAASAVSDSSTVPGAFDAAAASTSASTAASDKSNSFQGPAAVLSSNEREQLVIALTTTYGNKSAAALLLGISRGTLYNRIKKYGLNLNEFRQKAIQMEPN